MKNFHPGNFMPQSGYRSFQPSKINKEWAIDDMQLLHLLSQADQQIGKLDMYSEYVPDIDLYIRMHVAKEATQSSKIEGTQTNIKDVLSEKEYVEIEKRDDWEEVHNYIQALNNSITRLDKLPFSSRLIREAHMTLLQGVRGEHKLPGDFRTSQNWIGGATISDAKFIPPHHQTVPELMGDLEVFAHNDELHIPELLKVAILHYQFETIHPFLDGNGRVGRLMITLYLVNKGVLKKPILYLSDFFEHNRLLYYDNLMMVRLKGDMIQWCKFFLAGVIETARKGVSTFDQLLKLQKELEHKVQDVRIKPEFYNKLMTYLYGQPIIQAKEVAAIIDASEPTAYKLLKQFEDLGILQVQNEARYNKVYVFEQYLRLFES